MWQSQATRARQVAATGAVSHMNRASARYTLPIVQFYRRNLHPFTEIVSDEHDALSTVNRIHSAETGSRLRGSWTLGGRAFAEGRWQIENSANPQATT
jgi:hypothetical protein